MKNVLVLRKRQLLLGVGLLNNEFKLEETYHLGLLYDLFISTKLIRKSILIQHLIGYQWLLLFVESD